ncbi:MAG: hypothetical protein KF889_14025 [Alphaproteobacteria bacterium]|nr:hypothetical protein [Alphaproteobacteria bacterium]MCW5738885.1 hypothetical protein [Alphaproteobacteria bacterium]
MRSIPLMCVAVALPTLLQPAASFAQTTPTPTQPQTGRPLDLPRHDDPNAPTLGASLRAGYQIRTAVQTVEANPLIFIQKDSSARVCRAPMPREGAIAPRYAPDFGTYRCSEIK